MRQVVGVEEREDEIERLRHDGRVHFWSTRGSTRGSNQASRSGASASAPAASWPGHTTFVALRGGQVVLGDRYAGEGIERTYACELPALLEGCFQELVEQQLGSQVLAELLAEVRRELGVPAGTGASPKQAGSPTKNAQVPASESPAARTTSPPAAASAGASAPAAPAPAPSPSKVVSAPSKPRPVAAASERPSSPASAPAAPTAAAASTSAAHVDVTLVACSSVGLPLAVALRGITRAPVHELLGRLRSLPCRVAAGVPREQAEGLVARLSELGAEVRLVPAHGS